MTPNQAAPVNAPVTSWFQFRHLWRRVTEQRRSAMRRMSPRMSKAHSQMLVLLPATLQQHALLYARPVS